MYDTGIKGRGFKILVLSLISFELEYIYVLTYKMEIIMLPTKEDRCGNQP